MNDALLVAKLQSALEAMGNGVRDNPVYLSPVLKELETAHPSLRELVQVLYADPLLDIFKDKLQVLPSYTIRWAITDLAEWLIRKALDVGAVKVVADLQRYIEETQIPFTMVLGVAGLEVIDRCDLDAGISLVPWNHLQTSFQKHQTFTDSFEGSRIPTAALIRQIDIPKAHVSQRIPPLSPPDFSELHDALLCIGIVGPFGPVWTASWLEPPHWVPVRARVYHPSEVEEHRFQGRWDENHALVTSRLFQIFRRLPDNKKDALRLPMRRLNSAMRRLSNVDRAIDLGIALEALFLDDMNDDRGDLTFRLRLRMARYLGQDLEKRTALFKTAGKLYALRSAAVHTGHISNAQEPSDVLQWGCQVTAETIRRFIEEGSPDWMAVQLGYG